MTNEEKINKEYIAKIRKARAKYGAYSRVQVWNGRCYFVENNTLYPSELSGYYKGLINELTETLKNNENGSWVYLPKLKTWIESPLSLWEREQIKDYDPSAIDSLSLNLPVLPFVPE